jgi:PBP1b-binding outer membrane lipoprotein LpoB
MKRLALFLAALLAAGCVNSTAPDDAAAQAARAANAKRQLVGAAPTPPTSGKIATN